MSGDLKQAVRRRGSFRQTMRAVVWSFFGVRKGSDYEKDLNQLNPVHVVIAGVIGAALFVVALLLLVNWVLVSGAAK
jgi:Protein of unknown function (DUF2970)